MFKALGFLSVVVLAGCGQGGAPAIGESLEMVLVSGDAQSGVVGQELPSPVVVRVTNAKGKAVSGALINFRIVSGGGSVYAGAALSDADGLASERWTLGLQAGAQSLEARAVSSTGAELSYGLFTATGLPDVAKKLVARTPAQTDGLAGAPLSPAPAVQIADQYGNAVAAAGAPISFAVTSGGGSVSGAAAVTDATGSAAVGRWILGAGTNAQGNNTLVATSPGLDGVTFTATGRQAPATLAIVTGDNQTALAGVDPLPVRATVRVTDQFGNAVAGYALTFSVTSGGGVLDGGVVSRIVSTDYDGTASTGWTLGAAYGANTLTATAGATNPSQVIFHARRVQQVTVSPEQIDFGNAPVGGVSAPVTITLTNYGPGSVQCNKGSAVSPGFAEAGTNNCLWVHPGESCTLTMIFAPTAPGPTSGTYQPYCYPKDENGVISSPVVTAETASLTGNGVTGPLVSVSTPQLDFGDVPLDSSSDPLSFTLINHAQTAVQCNKGSLLPAGVTETRNDCLFVHPNESCIVSVIFSPTALGPLSGTYQPICYPKDSNGIITNVPVTSATASVIGNGAAVSIVEVSPSQLAFGTVYVGSSSAPQTVTLTNHGNRPLQCNKGSSLSAGFSESSNSCLDVLPGTSCTLSLIFTPALDGPLSGSYQPKCYPRDPISGVTDFTASAVADSAMLSGTGQLLTR